MKKIMIPVLALAAFTWLATGCKHGPETNGSNYETTAKYMPLDSAVQHSVSCPGIQRRNLPDGRLEVTASLRNRENRRIEVQVNCVFKDAQFFPTDETPFQQLILTENETKAVTFVSMNDKATNFTVRVRQAR